MRTINLKSCWLISTQVQENLPKSYFSPFFLVRGSQFLIFSLEIQGSAVIEKKITDWGESKFEKLDESENEDLLEKA